MIVNNVSIELSKWNVEFNCSVQNFILEAINSPVLKGVKRP